MAYVATTDSITRCKVLQDAHTVLIWFSRPMTIGTGGSGGFELQEGENTYALTYVAGDQGIVFIYTSEELLPPSAILAGAYVQPTDGIINYEDAGELPSSTFSVTNTAAAPPVFAGSQVDETGLVFSVAFDRNITLGTGGSAGFTLSGGTTISYDRIEDYTIYFNITNGAVTSAENLTCSYSQPGYGAGTGVLSDTSLTPATEFSGEAVDNLSEVSSLVTYTWDCMDNAADNVVVCNEDTDKNASVMNVATTSSIYNATYGLYLNGTGSSAIRATSIPAWGVMIGNMTLQAVFHVSGTMGTDYDVLFGIDSLMIYWNKDTGYVEAWSGDLLGASPTALGTAFSMLRLVVDYDAGELRLYSGTGEADLTLFHTWTNYTPVEYEGPSIYFGGMGANPYSFTGYVKDCKFIGDAVNP